MVRLRGVPTINRIIRRWARCSLAVSVFVMVQLELPYRTVGVMVVLNGRTHALSG